MKWTKKTRITIAVFCIVLGTASLAIFSQMNQVAEAAILTPIESPPETVFYDDFSGDLSNWMVVSGDWIIEGGKLRCSVIDGVDVPHVIYVNTSLTDFVYETQMQKISGHWAGLMFRGSSPPDDSGEYYLVLLGHSVYGVDSYWIGKRSGMRWIPVMGWSKLGGLNVTAGTVIKVDFQASALKVYIGGTQVYADSDGFRSSGVFGYVASGETANTQWNFDDINLSASSRPTAYEVGIRAGVTQITVTCTWSGSGNITIANITSPGPTYYESNMSIYERTTVSWDGTTSILNVRRAALSIAVLSSSETWILYLALNGVTPYQVSVETT